VLILLLLAGGCSRPIQPVPDPNWMPDSFSQSALPGTVRAPLPDQWWRSLEDPALHQLMEQALGNNFSIRSAWDRLTQAELIVKQANAALIPRVNYALGGRRTRSETGNSVTYSGRYDAGLSASYELDVWGKWRSTRKAFLLDMEARREDVAAAAMTLSAVVARTWYQLAEARQQVEVITRQRQTNQDVLDIVTLSFRQGKVGAEDVFRQRQLVESSEGQRLQAQERVDVLQHGLSVLVGRAPGAWWAEQTLDLVGLPDLPPTGLPAEVIQRRPDVRSAYKEIQAADQRMAVAVADRYPSISLSAGVDTTSSHLDDLFKDWSANLAANLVGPLYDAGQRKAEVDRQHAIVSQRINEYSQIVLEALQEVEDALTQEYYQQRLVANIQQQLATSRLTLDRLRQNYLMGQLDYLRVLESLSSSQTLERNEITARRFLIERRIDLCRAIAGSWDMDRPAQARVY
jgi:NodT family efflux transporter outer membrane factor (OMF) lipoprotein